MCIRFRKLTMAVVQAVCLHKTAARLFCSIAIASPLAFTPLALQAQALIAWSPGPLNETPNHNSPQFVARHIDHIESRPFDGIVLNEYFGRNLFNLNLVHGGEPLGAKGEITRTMVDRSFAPLVGKFKRMRFNLAKVNLLMTSLPPLLDDEAGWRRVAENVRIYAGALEDSGFRGIMIDNEAYFRPAGEKKKSLDYWLASDQRELMRMDEAAMPLSRLIELARLRGRSIAKALFVGYPTIDVIVAHGPYVGCTEAAQRLGTFGIDQYLMGAFFAGMVEEAPFGGQIIDGGELYELRSEDEFRSSREVRLSIGTRKGAPLDNPNRTQCPFMTQELNDNWRSRVGIAHGTFDRARKKAGHAELYDDVDSVRFEQTLKNAARYSDKYVWHYTQWQDWLGPTQTDEMAAFDKAVRRARLSFRTPMHK